MEEEHYGQLFEHYEQLYVDDIYGYTARHHQSPGHVISLDQSEASVRSRDLCQPIRGQYYMQLPIISHQGPGRDISGSPALASQVIN